MTRIVVNQAYQAQRITGQQRYAHEISRRLEDDPDFVAAAPDGRWWLSVAGAWAWVQVVLPLRARRRTVLSLTARAPWWRRRHVLVVHDLFVLTHPEWYSRRYIWTHAPLLRAQIASAAAVVAVSEPVARELARYRGHPVPVAPNAPSEELSSDPVSGEGGVPDALGLVPGSYFLTVGSRDPRKNLPRLAEAYARLPAGVREAHPLVVVGGGSAIFRSEQIRWPSGVVETGYVTDSELSGLYRAAHTVVFVSLAEGFGLPLVEAAAAGAASLLISDIPVFRWICGDAVHYADPLSVTSIAAGLRASLDAPRRQEIDLRRFRWELSADVIREACLPAGARSAARPVRSVGVVLASAGRPNLLAAAVRDVDAQRGIAVERVISVPDEASLPEDRASLADWRVVTGVRGLAAQRNAGLAALPAGTDVVLFFDDDAVVRDDYVARAVRFLDEHPEIVGLTGRVLRDGKLSGEIDDSTARAIVRASGDEEPTGVWRAARELYGANFAIRIGSVPSIRFDERLPLYSWLEDHDMARRLLRSGPLAQVDDCVIVHRAAASGGRTNHLRLGYSQVMNPVHLVAAGSFPLWLAAQQLFRPVAKNLALSVTGRSSSWRRLRARGNLRAARDLLRGRISPERIIEF